MGYMNYRFMIDEFKSNFVAILSLTIAIMALLYTTWREEVTERNRNYRLAAFEILKHLGELQIVIDYSVYQPQNTMGNPILGWGHIALISDLGQLMPSPIPEKVNSLTKVWGENWEKIQTKEIAADEITSQIDGARSSILYEIRHFR